jgi:hypothetical protein
LFNCLLGAERWLRSAVSKKLQPEERVVEFGAGDGSLARKMVRCGLPWDGLDLVGPPNGWPGDSARWLQVDALTFQVKPPHRVVVASLFLHHFDKWQLRQLGDRLVDSARVIVVTDLWRSRWREWVFACLCWVVRAHPVSRHDGALSIRAGFRDDELPDALGLSSREWRWEITHTLAGAYRMIAVKQQ